MKILNNIKLINWHRFENPDPISVGPSTLLSGENGSGKTTLLDAVMYVLLSSSANFNSAAHLNGKRKVTTYVRCKTGRENSTYEREGSVTSHIALEFYEEEKDSYFILGAVIDSISETQEQTYRYLINNKRLTDISFIHNNKPRSSREFKTANNISTKNWYKTQKEARAAFTNRLGRIEQNRFLDLVPKAVAFRPIDDIKDFVYSYVLDEKDINIEDLQDYVQSYQELLELLERTKKKLAELEEINKSYESVESNQKKIVKYDYFIAQAKLEENLEKIKNLQRDLKIIEEEIQSNKKTIDTLNSKLNNINSEKRDLEIELANNEEYLTLNNLKEKQRDYSLRMKQIHNQIYQLVNESKKALKLLKDHSEILDDSLVTNYENFLININETEDLTQAKILIQDIIENKSTVAHNLLSQRIKLEADLKEKRSYQTELEKEIKLLKNNERNYPKNTWTLFQNLKKAFNDIKKNSNPIILCEGLEIEDDSWRNAIEGYLNTQRFYILVDPDDYDYSLAIYDQLRKKGKTFGVGLINAGKLENFDKIPENSLASVVSTTNPYLRRYINFVLGRVHLCEDKNDLKKYKASITRECMKYQNHVASAIKPEIFKVPWIGKKSYRLQLKVKEKELKELNKEIQSLESEIRSVNSDLKVTNTDTENYILHNLDNLFNYRQLKQELSEIEDQIKRLEKNKTLIQKRIQIEELETQINEISNEIRHHDRESGKLEQKKETKLFNLKDYQNQTSYLTEDRNEILNSTDLDTKNWETEFKKKLKDTPYSKFIENYNKYKNTNLNQVNKEKELLFNLMAEFKSNHQFGAPATMEGYKEFRNHYDKLVSTELVEYEDQVQQARQNAEIEFREQFLSKLQENIRQAQNEFKELNNALKNVTFNSESYRFIYKPNPEREVYYRLIMDPNNVGTSVFQGVFYERHKDEIQDLFDAIKDNDFEVNALTDYRNYLSFDIEIRDEDSNKTLYSKVCREKSGGETQTPFYVAIAASFVQLYSNSISNESTGLIMFDEAFNNMDDERINGVLQFFKQLPLQVIISAPPDKIQYIAPFMDQINIITNMGRRNLIHEYSNENLKKAI